MRCFLVTGGCGFIGSHLVDALIARGDQVRVIDDLSSGCRSNLSRHAHLTIGDIADEKALGSLIDGADGVFHLAAVASVQRCNEAWRQSHCVNQSGTIGVFEASLRAGRIPVVYASSASVYGDNPNVPLRESERPRPITAYGVDKFGSELHAEVAGRIHGIPTFGFRFFNVFGPRQDVMSPYSGVISIFVDRLRSGRKVMIHGDGGQTRDFVFVSDVIQHLLAGMEMADTGAPVCNVCTGKETSIRELAEVLCDLTGCTGMVSPGPERVGDIRTSVGCPDVAVARLSVRTKVSLLEGLSYLLR